MFGHIEEPWELAAPHARRPRAAGAHRRDHRVRAAQLHPLQHAARPHARDRGDLARGEPQAHGRLPAGARQDDHEPAGELGEDGPRRRDREPALGRQRPRRHADGGEHLAHGRLPARRAARPAAADRAPRAARAASRPSAPRSTRSSRRTERAGQCVRAMVLDAAAASRFGSAELPEPEPGPARCCCGCTPAASAGPTCTWSTASCPSPKLPLVPGHQIVGTVEAVGGGRRALRGRRARRRAVARLDGRGLPVLPLGPGEPLRRARRSPAISSTAATPSWPSRDEPSASRSPMATPTSRRRRCCAPG